MTVLGLDEPSTCICAGSHAADPHYTERLGCIERGNCLLMDFGGTYQGYYTDMTQTFWFDDPDPEFVPGFMKPSAKPTLQQRRPPSWKIRCRTGGIGVHEEPIVINTFQKTIPSSSAKP